MCRKASQQFIYIITILNVFLDELIRVRSNELHALLALPSRYFRSAMSQPNPYAVSGDDINPFEESNRPHPGSRTPPPRAQTPPRSQTPPKKSVPEFYQPTGTQGQSTSTPYDPNANHNQYGSYDPPPATNPQFQGGYQQPQYNQQRTESAPPPQYGEHPQQQQEAPPPARELATSKFWTMAFYQQFFECDTRDVLRRMGNTLVPISPPDFLLNRKWHANQNPQIAVETVETGPQEEARPDMYGPFWVCTTLWMTLAIVGNMMSKISHSHAKATGNPLVPADWSYDFTVASVACVAIYVYVCAMSLILWGIMKWKNVPVTLLDTIALYGYSMFIWLLAAILCSIPNAFAQWIICIVAGLYSLLYLLMNLWHVWKISMEAVWFFGVVLLVGICHMGMAMSFKFYFLNYDLN